jgi:hypothetical protein
MGAKVLSGFVCNCSSSRVRLELGTKVWSWSFCDGTLKEGISVLKPAGLGKRTGGESREILIEMRENVRTLKRSDGRGGVRWMKE